MELDVEPGSVYAAVGALWQADATAVVEDRRGETVVLHAGFADDDAYDTARRAPSPNASTSSNVTATAVSSTRGAPTRHR